MRLDELNSILNGGTGSVADNCGETLTPLSMSATRELDTLLRNQQSLLRQIADSRSQVNNIRQLNLYRLYNYANVIFLLQWYKVYRILLVIKHSCTIGLYDIA